MPKDGYDQTIHGSRANYRAMAAKQQPSSKPKAANGHAAVDGVEIPIAPTPLEELAVLDESPVRPTDDQVLLWRGKIAKAAHDGGGLDVLQAAITWIKENVPQENGLLEQAKQDIRDTAESHLGEDLVAAIFQAAFPKDTVDVDLDAVTRENDIINEIGRLAKLSRVTYASERKIVAESLGIGLGELDDAVKRERAEKQKQADVLIGVAKEAELFHSPDDRGYADVIVHGNRQTFPIRSKGFKQWLAREFYDKEESAPNSDALQSALNVIEAKAHFDGVERPVYVRVGGHGGKIYLDLGDSSWKAVEVDADGWRIVDRPPIRFRRPAGMAAIPAPIDGGSISDLRPFLNVKTENDFVLAVAWALAVLRDRGPYPVLVLSGEHGAAKTTFLKILQELLDPTTATAGSLPREERDLFIAANNGHVIAFDNVSALSPWISDALCRVATGGAYRSRALYTDEDENLIKAIRPVILNGIEDIVTRPDLADRSILMTLGVISTKARRLETELWSAFEAARPRILGALLTAVAAGLKRLPTIKLAELPRMADFAMWGAACEIAPWSEDARFIAAYNSNQDKAVEEVIDGDPIASAVRSLMAKAPNKEWSGTATALLETLAFYAGERLAKSKGWPDGARALSGRLRRAATFLRKVGIDIENSREGKEGTRMVTLTLTEIPKPPEREGDFASVASAASAKTQNPNNTNGLAQNGGADANGFGADADEVDGFCVSASVSDNPLENKDNDATDVTDANPHTQSGWSEL